MAAMLVQLPEAQAWLFRLRHYAPNRGLSNDCPCKGFGPLPLQIGRLEDEGDASMPGTPFWEYISRMDGFLLDSAGIHHLNGFRKFMSHGVLSYVMAHLEEAMRDCVQGVSAFLLNALALKTAPRWWTRP